MPPSGVFGADSVAVPPTPSEPVTLRVLWGRYSRECGDFLDNDRDTRADAERSVRLLIAVFGTDREVRTITPRDPADYAERRRKGGIRYRFSGRKASDDNSDLPVIRTAGPVRRTAIHRDLFSKGRVWQTRRSRWKPGRSHETPHRQLCGRVKSKLPM